MVDHELERAVAELARRLRDDLGAGLDAKFSELAIERYVYEVVNLHIEALRRGPLLTRAEIERRFDAALGHAAEAAGLPREAIARHRDRAHAHWQVKYGLGAAMSAIARPLEELRKLSRGLHLQITRPLWGLPTSAPAPAQGAGVRAAQDARHAEELAPAEKPETARGREAPKPQPEFANRARWFRQMLRKKHLSLRRLFEDKNGPSPKTAARILRGQAVREDVLVKLAEALGVPLEKIPRD